MYRSEIKRKRWVTIFLSVFFGCLTAPIFYLSRTISKLHFIIIAVVCVTSVYFYPLFLCINLMTTLNFLFLSDKDFLILTRMLLLLTRHHRINLIQTTGLMIIIETLLQPIS